VTTWQPIATAPKDGTRILLFRPTADCALHCVIGYWNNDTRRHSPRPYWSHDAEHVFGIKEARRSQPAFWMPLPEGPALQSELRDRVPPYLLYTRPISRRGHRPGMRHAAAQAGEAHAN
jgi:hypothetical protein